MRTKEKRSKTTLFQMANHHGLSSTSGRLLNLLYTNKFTSTASLLLSGILFDHEILIQVGLVIVRPSKGT